MSKGRVIVRWCAARRMPILYYGICAGILFAVYGLYGYPWGVAGYTALLMGAAGLGFAIFDFVRFAAQYSMLEKLPGRFPLGPLPEPGDLLEEQYTAVIEALEEERLRVVNRADGRRRDAEEYYTLWVHQIKTPIAATRLLLQSGGAGGGESAALEQELYRIEQYVEMVLQYQRLHSMQGDLLLKEHTLASLVNKAARGCAPLFIYKNLPLQAEGVQGSIVTDEKWFCFVLEQLLTNAAKYTAKGHVAVYTQGHRLVVEDTGSGIPPEDVARVFERGFTGAAGRAERSSTGIGLYLSREILRRLGFSIRLESEPHKGTRVILELAQQRLAVD